MHDTSVIKIDRLGYGGDGISRLADGRVVFVPYTIPGEVVRVRLVEEKAHHAIAEVVEVLEASPERVAARCKHFMICGGCHYQHMSYPASLNAKAEILRGQMERLGGFKQLPTIEIMPSPESWNYRNYIQFHLTRGGELGFQKTRSTYPFAIQECHLPEAGINRLWPNLAIEPIPSLSRVSIRQGVDEEVVIVLESSIPQALEFNIENPAVSIVQTDPAGSLVLAGSDHLVMNVLGRLFFVSAASFFQVNTAQASGLVQYLLDQIPLSSEMTVVDVFCGVGLFSAFLAARVKQLVGIEVSAEACEDFSTNLDEFENVELYEAPAEDVLGSVQFKPDVIIVDPPRAGLGTKATAGVLSQGAESLVYVSCDPATLARDGKTLASGGYSLKKLTMIDMFPQTYHIESISLWIRSN